MISPASGAVKPGPWRNDKAPYLVEVMDCLGLDHPAETVAFKKSAQIGATEAGINLVGWIVCQNPAPIMIVLPTTDEATKYNRIKLETAIAATPAMRDRIAEHVSRDERGSTNTFKPFFGGFCVITGANSSTGLQMLPARVIIFEEVSGYPADAGGRGEPTAQAESRSKSFVREGRKFFYNSTPALAGDCRVTAKYEASDQRRYYVPCPHCRTAQVLRWDRLKWRQDQKPYGAYYECEAHGCVIEGGDRDAMVQHGTWIKTFDGGPDNPAPPATIEPGQIARWRARSSGYRQPGFALWQAYSPFVDWDATVDEYMVARNDPRKLKVFWQQALGEPWEEKGEAPDSERLLERRENWPAHTLPPGVLLTTGAVDVQGNRLEWAVYGWGRDLTSWLLDRGVIEGDPNDDGVWSALDQVIERRYRDAWQRQWPVDQWGIDAGYLSQRVYRFVRGHAASGRVVALDGRARWKLPAMGNPTTVDVDYAGRKIGAVQLWPVGTWDLKSEVYAALRKTLLGANEDGMWLPGAMHFSDRADKTTFEQLTAESLVDVRNRAGYSSKAWVKGRQRNEDLDLAVYARALARRETDNLLPEDWNELEAKRIGLADEIQTDFASIWAPTVRDKVRRQASEPPPQPEPVTVETPPAHVVAPLRRWAKREFGRRPQ